MNAILILARPLQASFALSRTGTLPVLPLTLMLFLAMLPFAAHFVTFHPDERHYTDGALQMMQHGDYLTPRTADGTLRFNKPVATYWLVAVGYQTLGVSPLAGRLAFLLIAVAIVFTTHRTAILLYNDRQTALWAAAIVATHAPLLSVAVNTLPEVPLTLCWLTCAYGFLGIIVRGERRSLFYWAAYGAAGVGVAVKGLPILILVAYAIAFAQLNPWRRVKLADLWHAPSIMSAVAIGSAWYIAVFARHGDVAFAMFVNDQLTDRVGFSLTGFLRNLGLVGVCYLLSFFPWNLPLLTTFRRRDEAPVPFANSPNDLLTTGFILSWAIVMGVVIAAVDRFAARYVLAVTPLLAVTLAQRLRTIDRSALERLARQMRGVIAALTLTATMLMLLVHLQLAVTPQLTVTGLLLGTIALVLMWHRHWQLLDLASRNALAALCLLPLLLVAAQPLVLPDSGTEFAEQIRQLHLLGRTDILYVGNPALVSKSRVAAEGELPLPVVDDLADLIIPEYSRVLVRADDRLHLVHADYGLEAEFTAGVQSYRPLPLLAALLNGTIRDYLSSQSQRFLVLRQKISDDNEPRTALAAGQTIPHSEP